ncbi:hypothetical protein MesoLjLc_69760 [Mesorhizobium sp. L-8-10]|nr:hypothetical protein MesoLjLc_69760 [Mesorhizobium sp. L-8-10]
MGGLIDNGVGAPLLDDAAKIHDDDPVADMANDPQVMADEQEAEPELLLNIHEQIDDLRLDGHVERRDRLIANQKRGFWRERPRKHDALALAAGKLMRIEHAMVFAEADAVEKLGHALLAACRIANSVNRQRLGDESADSHSAIKRCQGVLKDQLHLAPLRAPPSAVDARQRQTLKQHTSAVRRLQTERNTAGGGLAASGFADNAGRPAHLDIQRHAIDCYKTFPRSVEWRAEGKATGDVVETQQGH